MYNSVRSLTLNLKNKFHKFCKNSAQVTPGYVFLYISFYFSLFFCDLNKKTRLKTTQFYNYSNKNNRNKYHNTYAMG